jgi:hypothetical protein
MLGVTKTVFRAGYARTFETPYNENLLLSSFAGPNGFTDLQKSAQQMEPGRRNQFNIGFQQAFGRFVQVDADYFWKFTRNAYDFDVILNTPLTFPISWDESRLDGFSIRVSTPDLHGFQAYTTMGHTRTRFFPPELGGVLFNSPLAATVFRIDHDQAFQQTSSVRYQWKRHGPWGAFTWRYDSGLVAGAVGSLEDALGLTAAQQAAIGFFCGADTATISHRIENCTSPNFGATRFRIPAPGTLDNDHNPPRVAPRHVFDVGMGTDNLLSRNEGSRITLRFTISNLANKIALYNFLSTFSGTHFIAPRSYQGAVGFVF